MSTFYFAWVNSDEITFINSYLRVDEEIVTARIEQSEGEFATLTIDVKNPRVALLAPARKVWAWFSYDEGSGAVPLFFGRLQGVPNNIHKEIVTLVFIAQPSDFNYQKAALAEAMRVAPYWDPVFLTVDKRDDPDAVLEARTEMWNIDRTTHIVSTSDLLVGEDGLEDFSADEVPYDSVGITIKEAPLQAIDVIASVNWTQKASGTISVYKNAKFPMLPTKGLEELWPKTGTGLGGGWTVALGEAIADTDNLKPISISSTSKVDFPDSLSDIFNDPAHTTTTTYSFNGLVPLPPGSVHLIFAAYSQNTGGGIQSTGNGLDVLVSNIYGTLSLSYEAARDRTEQLRFTLTADVQPVITLAGDEVIPTLAIAGTDVGLPLDSGGTVPIIDVARRSYFSTDRGLQGVEYAILAARAALVLRSRAVEVTFHCLYSRAVNLSLRKNAQLADPRIPSGAALGKIVHYAIIIDGPTGDAHGEITMACAIGIGGAVAAAAGTPTWVEEGYVDVGYQYYENQIVVAGTSDVGYTVPIDAPNDDGITFPLRNPFMPGGSPAVSHYRSLGGGRYTDVGPLVPPPNKFDLNNPLAPGDEASTKAYIDAVEARMDFTLRPVTGSKFNTAYDVGVTALKIPAQINLGGL